MNEIRRAGALLAVGILTLPIQACAAAVVSGERELAWDSQTDASAHVQAQVTATPVVGFAFTPWAWCAVDAEVRGVFKGSQLFRPGKEIRLRFQSVGDWYLDGREARSDNGVACNLSKGDKVEVFLDRNNSVVGSSLFSIGLYKLREFTVRPTVNPENRPAWYRADNLRFISLGRKTIDSTDMHADDPPGFPKTDVVVTYTTTSSPHKVYTASFSSSSRRIVVRRPGGFFSRSEHVILDPVTSTEAVLDDANHTYTLVPYNDVVFDRLEWPMLRPAMLGVDTIAGYRCKTFKFEISYTLPPIKPAIACVTQDGIRLKRVQDGVTQIVSSVSYRALQADEGVIPDNYKRVRGSEDFKAPPRPRWID